MSELQLYKELVFKALEKAGRLKNPAQAIVSLSAGWPNASDIYKLNAL
jgi:hypothetical protein